MAARAIWAGTLKIGPSSLPVQLYSVQDKSVHFHILDAKSKSRVKQHMVNPSTGEEVAKEDIRKGYELERGTFVLLDDDELSKLVVSKITKVIHAKKYSSIGAGIPISRQRSVRILSVWSSNRSPAA